MKVLNIRKNYINIVIGMKINECKECKSKNILVTKHLNGEIFGATCLNCGWEFESPTFKKIYSEMEDIFKDFDRTDILKTKSSKF